MTPKATTSGVRPSLPELVHSILRSYQRMEMPFRRYAQFVLAPALFCFVLLLVGALTLPFPLYVRLPMIFLGLLVVLSVLAYPRIVLNRRKIEMDDRFHLATTHMTILATTNIDRIEVFRRLGNETEYGAIAEEISRIVQLVDVWNQSLDDACRRRAQAVPSKALSDFFDRLAYTLSSGQSLDDFLLNEQQFIIGNYVTHYEGTLENLEVMKDLYLSMILSMTFALVFAIVLPILTGTNPTLTVAAVIVMFVLVQLGFYMVIVTMSPYDPVWYHPETIVTRSERRIRASVIGALVLSVLCIATIADVLGPIRLLPLAGMIPALDSIPQQLYPAIPITPLILPGLVLHVEEKRITARDREFPSFIRALGSSESVKQSTTSNVLRSLRRKDFGPLTPNVDELYKRLNMRIDQTAAWHYFAADTRSYLIQKFCEMYLVGRQMGGSPKRLGELISQNMNEVNQLREQRKQSTVTLIGLLYGITAAATFAFFIGLQVVEILANMNLEIGASGAVDVGRLIHTDVYNILLIEYLLLVVILFNAVLSSLMIRTVDGGHKANAYIHFVLLTWISCLTAVVTSYLVGSLLSI